MKPHSPRFLDLNALPRPLAFAIFALLPADQRLRCSEVSRAWRALLADTSLWTCLNLSGIRFSEALFRAAVAKAGGQLRLLDVTGHGTRCTSFFPMPILLDALASNAATLKRLLTNCFPWYTAAEVEQIVEAAPLSVCCLNARTYNVELACRYLRNEPPYEQLRLTGLFVPCGGQLSLESLEALCTDLLKHPSLTHIGISNASLGTAAAMRVFVNAVITSRVTILSLVACGCTRACVPELTRLVSAGVVRTMVLNNGDVQLFEAGADTDQFCAAARASASLRHLELVHCGPNPDAAAVAAFVTARRQ